MEAQLVNIKDDSSDCYYVISYPKSGDRTWDQVVGKSRFMVTITSMQYPNYSWFGNLTDVLDAMKASNTKWLGKILKDKIGEENFKKLSGTDYGALIGFANHFVSTQKIPSEMNVEKYEREWVNLINRNGDVKEKKEEPEESSEPKRKVAKREHRHCWFCAGPIKEAEHFGTFSFCSKTCIYEFQGSCPYFGCGKKYKSRCRCTTPTFTCEMGHKWNVSGDKIVFGARKCT